MIHDKTAPHSYMSYKNIEKKNCIKNDTLQNGTTYRIHTNLISFLFHLFLSKDKVPFP